MTYFDLVKLRVHLAKAVHEPTIFTIDLGEPVDSYITSEKARDGFIGTDEFIEWLEKSLRALAADADQAAEVVRRLSIPEK